MITKCKYCGYEGETHFYRNRNHCHRCNRLVGKDLEECIRDSKKMKCTKCGKEIKDIAIGYTRIKNNLLCLKCAELERKNK
jgi:hypothetical protein